MINRLFVLFFGMSLISNAYAVDISGTVNTYVKGSGDVVAGSTSIDFTGAFLGAGLSISTGNTLLLIQSQGAKINTTNTDSYGDGVGTGANISTTPTSAHGTAGYAGGLISQTAGTFEYVEVASVVGSTVNLTTGLSHDYFDADEANWQIVVVPDYLAAGVRLTGSITGVAWNGNVGGVIAFNATGGTVDFNSQTIDASGIGFRGGVELDTAATTDNIANVTEASNNAGGKGEGIAGTPKRVFNGNSIVDSGSSTLAGGDYGRGAPGNAGGGAGPHNSGGGGGSNAGKGGTGAQGYVDGTPVHFAGYGGQSIFAGANMGGGGGSGEANNSTITHGGLGGGVIIIRADTATGSGSINALGDDALDATSSGLGHDGAGGAGAGGSILIFFDTPPTLPGLIVNASGGQGGDGDPAHGGGGGGGAGFVTVKADVGSVTTLGGAKGANEGGVPSEPGGSSTSNTGINAFITLNTDYGDAPNTYGTISGGLGAYHSFQDNNFDGVINSSETLLLGSKIDGEGGGNPSVNANSDDAAGEDDEDGITNLADVYKNATGYTIDNTNIFITNQLGTIATLHAWLDFDNNGTFDADEHTSITVADGLSNQNPAADLIWASAPGLSSVTPDSKTYLRFRLTTDTNITASLPTGPAANGEVEDYVITVLGPPPDAYVYYNFNDNVDDLSGNNNHGSSAGIGSTYVTNGYSGKSLSFSGSSYIVMPDNLVLNNQNFTISLYFKTTSTDMAILGYQNVAPVGVATNYIPLIGIDPAGKLRTTLWPTRGAPAVQVTSPGVVNDGAWHRVVMTANTTAGTLSTYLDGIPLNTANLDVAHLDMAFNQIGYTHSNSHFSNYYYTGELDEFIFYREALTDAEIAKTTQSITFNAIADQYIGDSTMALSATASSSLAVTYTSTTLPVCTVSGSTVSFVSVGSCKIQADQVGNGIYSSAPAISQTFTIFSNTAPVAGAQSLSTNEDTAKTITLSATDGQLDVLTYAVVTAPTKGVLSGTAPNLTYTPNANYFGNDSFTFKANDGLLDSNTATVSITINSVNDRPLASAQSLSTLEDTAKIITLAGSDIDGIIVSYSVGAVSNGTLTGTAPNLTYTPNENFNGSDSFTFTVTDNGSGVSNAATIALEVTSVNDLPVATAQSVSVTEDTPKVITLAATDVDGTIALYSVGTPSSGALSGTAPNLTYTPNLNFNGSDSFTFTVTDDQSGVSTASTVSISISSVNDMPIANAQLLNVVENQPKVFVLTGADVDGSIISYAVGSATKGVVSGTAPNLTYTPNADYFGADSFTFTVTDNQSGTSTAATVSITVQKDLDGDGIPDVIDPDKDGDGIPNITEGARDTDNDTIPDDEDLDSDNDGIADSDEGIVDTDADGTPNYKDTDSDSDGINDAIEGVLDTDNDGIPDYLDVDSDGDGIPDREEGNGDADGDGIPDRRDTDSDGDGIPDSDEGNEDTDGDGLPDYKDTDSDGDGIGDRSEGNKDTNNDGTPDYKDTDSDGDGIPDSEEGVGDADGDGIPDSIDTDSDGDGIPDAEEGTGDSDGDGIPDRRDTDSDGDGIPDSEEGYDDLDNDGIPDFKDTDSDGDGILDVNEGTGDSDGDGILDYKDTDTDGDGVSDIDEGNEDTDGDGIPNYLDTDADGDGIPDIAEGTQDTDNDGIPDFLDTDADGDGIGDIGEGSVDTDNDGIPNYLDTDADGDNLPDAIEGAGDTDNDGIPNYLDSDTDGDGISDLIEGVVDNDNDGLSDYNDLDSDGDGVGDAIEGIIDTDNDGIPNYLDLDSDGDNIPDSVEGIEDLDGDGILDVLDPDADGDGISDVIEGVLDTDNDGTPNYRDSDSDGDGIPDSEEGNIDSDTDTIPNYLDEDSDDDGIPDATEGVVDVDGDGIPNYLDTDSDGDGISDLDEGHNDADMDGIPDSLDTDADNDGIPDSLESTIDTDNDGIPDYKDTDSDNDGISDGDEGAMDSDSDGIPDYKDTDSDNDGISDQNEGSGDADNDGILDYRDTDSDNDGINDGDEGSADSDNDGTPDYLDSSTDEDGDGIPDIVEGTDDSDGDGIPDYRDNDSDNDGIPDSLEQLVTLSGVDSDNDGIDDSYDVDQTGGTDNNNDGVDDATFIDSDNDGIPNYLDVDSDNDGIPDTIEVGLTVAVARSEAFFNVSGRIYASNSRISSTRTAVDTDHDGVFDYLDLDSDNDGASDTSESQVTLTFDGTAMVIDDADGDGIADAFDVDFTGGIDSNMDGIDDAVISRDTDLDGLSDYLDLDSDNDSILDVKELGLIDVDNDGIADLGQTITSDLRDTDNDGIPDLRDLDSDGDGSFDIGGSSASRLDLDNDGKIDELIDGDNDGIMDAVDGEPNQRGSTQDGDSDGVPSQVDRDDDEDGIADSRESDADDDHDGTPNRLDRDSDGDGIPDRFEANRPNSLGVDSDFDGIDDAFDVDATGGIDADSDGIDDAFQETDIDNDGLPDYLDTDADGDGIPDNIEQMLVLPKGNDADFDGIDDAYDVDVTGGLDLNKDGIDDALLDLSDMDGDGLLNFRDTDSDGDGYSDVDENGDYNKDGIPDYRQLDPGLKTALDGNGGSLNLISLFGLLMLAFARLGGGIKRLCMLGFSVILSLVFASASSQAQERICQQDDDLNIELDGCFYGGFGVGQSRLAPEDKSTGWALIDEGAIGYKMTIGYRFLPQWYTELSYADLGSANIENLNPAITGVEGISYKAPSLNLGYYVLSPDERKWNVFIKGGIASIQNTASAARVPFKEVKSTQYLVGLGAEYQLTPHFFARAEIDSYDSDAQQFVLSLNSYFGKRSKPVIDSVNEPALTQPLVVVEEVVAVVPVDHTVKVVIAEAEPVAEDLITPVIVETLVISDSDQDGILDDTDACMDTPLGIHVNEVGCAVFEGDLKGIQFELGSVDLTLNAQAILDEIGSALAQYASLKLEVQAHTDYFGSRSFNLELSQKRAQSVMDYLVSKGVASDRLEAKGYGEVEPIASNETKEGRAENRRVEFIVLEK